MKINRKSSKAAGPWKKFADVPEKYRLKSYQQRYEGVDLWAEFVADQYDMQRNTYRHRNKIDNVETQWKEFCSEYDRHHALATPEMVNEWTSSILNEVTQSSAYSSYLVYLIMFYRYLRYHIDYLHTYNPVLYAIQMYPCPRKVTCNWRGEIHE